MLVISEFALATTTSLGRPLISRTVCHGPLPFLVYQGHSMLGPLPPANQLDPTKRYGDSSRNGLILGSWDATSQTSLARFHVHSKTVFMANPATVWESWHQIGATTYPSDRQEVLALLDELQESPCLRQTGPIIGECHGKCVGFNLNSFLCFFIPRADSRNWNLAKVFDSFLTHVCVARTKHVMEYSRALLRFSQRHSVEIGFSS